MKVEQIYTKCLSQSSYYIESDGEAVIIDPLRESEPYIDRIQQSGAKLLYVLETHFHADFVSGHLTLSNLSGAKVVFGPGAEPSFDAKIARNGETFKVGEVSIVAVHTPGHTMESTTYLLKDERGCDYAIFTGDTLFLGDVGRPDLAQKSTQMTQEQMAGVLYDSIRESIMPLGDDVLVYPAHGCGSACGKNMMKATVDTLGNQKKANYALRSDMTKEEFVREVIEGLTAPPAYFPMNIKMNKEGYKDFDEVLDKSYRGLSPDAFENLVEQSGALVLDVRHQGEFEKAHIPSSVFIGLDGAFAPWVGSVVIDVTQPILLVAPREREQEAITRLSRVGFDNVLGYLNGGISAWKDAKKDTDYITSVSVDELPNDNFISLDVRKYAEYTTGHLKNACHVSLDNLNSYIDKIPKKSFYIYCAGGYRSMIAASILKRKGIHDFRNILGGVGEIQNAKIPLVMEQLC